MLPFSCRAYNIFLARHFCVPRPAIPDRNGIVGANHLVSHLDCLVPNDPLPIIRREIKVWLSRIGVFSTTCYIKTIISIALIIITRNSIWYEITLFSKWASDLSLIFQGQNKDPFFAVDLDNVVKKHRLWTKELPHIQPYYGKSLPCTL